MDGCVFCKIIAGVIATEFIYTDDEVVAFKDIKPSAPVHVLVVPKKHVQDLNAVGAADVNLIGKLQLAAAKISQQLKIDTAYKIVINGGNLQEVPHLHYHLLGGWAPAQRGFGERGE